MDNTIQRYAAEVAAGWKPLSEQQKRMLANRLNQKVLASSAGRGAK